jgi:hypothetical protein
MAKIKANFRTSARTATNRRWGRGPERERERDRERDRGRETETERQREREGLRVCEGEKDAANRSLLYKCV